MSDNILATKTHTLLDEPTASQPLIKRNLSLLGHVNVKLDVVVGQTELTVDRLFALAQGDVVTLDAGLDEPVKIRLDGKTIALGHLMAVGDQFGVKITEIL